MKKALITLVVTAVAALGVAGPSVAKSDNDAKGGNTTMRIGDGWCC